MGQRDDVDRLRLATYPRTVEIRSLFSDMDVFQHINNNALGRYFEEGRADLNIAIFGREMLVYPSAGLQLLFANTVFDFIKQVRYPGTVIVGTGVGSLGNSSFVFAQGAFQHGEAVALSEAVVVKAKDGKSLGLSDDERQRIGAVMLRRNASAG